MVGARRHLRPHLLLLSFGYMLFLFILMSPYFAHMPNDVSLFSFAYLHAQLSYATIGPLNVPS